MDKFEALTKYIAHRRDWCSDRLDVLSYEETPKVFSYLTNKRAAYNQILAYAEELRNQ